METTYKCVKVIGPYDGPFSYGVKTYILNNNHGDKIYWHEGPNKSLNVNVGDLVKGIKIRKDNVIDYKNSFPVIVLNQLDLF